MMRTCKEGHPWVPENRYVSPSGKTGYCRICHREAQKRQNREKGNWRTWNDANRRKAIEGVRDWQRKNPDKVAAYQKRRRSAIRDYVIDIDRLFGDRCSYCGTTDNLALDHIEPLAPGGKHSAHNMVRCCRRCNASKGNRTLLFWLLKRAS